MMVVSNKSGSISKKIHCNLCNKKCTGNVLRYQDHYYHKQCFESSYNAQDSSQLQGEGEKASRIEYQKNHQQEMSSSEAASKQQQKKQQHQQQQQQQTLPLTQTSCAGCGNKIKDGQALVALDLHWHIWCFKCSQCQAPLHGEYVAKDGKAYCEKDYQKLFGVVCVYCKRYITGKVLQAGEAHHFHPSCARCSKCGDPFVPGEEMYLQGEVTWHPRCGPSPGEHPASASTGALAGADNNGAIEYLNDSSSRSQLRASRTHSPSLSSRSRSASPFSYISRQYGRSSPVYADSEAVGDLSRIYTISYLNADPTQGYLRRPLEPNPPKSPQFSRPSSAINRDNRSRSSSRSQQHHYANSSTGSGYYTQRERSVPRGMYSVLSSMRGAGSSVRARSPSMMNEEPIQLAQYPSGQKPSPDAVAKIERDDFPAPPFPYPHHHQQQQEHNSYTSGGKGKKSATKEREKFLEQETNGQQQQQEEEDVDQSEERSVKRQSNQQQQQQQRASRPRSREIVIDDDDSSNDDPQLRKEEEELSKIASGIGKIFLQTLKEREKLRAWKRANLDPRNASRTPSATRELPHRLRYDNPTNASPSRDLDRPRPWEEEEGQVGSGILLDHSPTRTRSSLGRPSQLSASNYGYKVVQSNRSTPKPGYGLSSNGLSTLGATNGIGSNTNYYDHYNQQQQQQHCTLPATLPSSQSMSFAQQLRGTQNRSTDLLTRTLPPQYPPSNLQQQQQQQSELLTKQNNAYQTQSSQSRTGIGSSSSSMFYSSPYFRRSMPNVNNLQHLHQEGPPKLYPYHLLTTSNYRLPPGVDRCHLERHLSNEEFQYIFHCDRLDFYRLPEWKRNELKRRAKLF